LVIFQPVFFTICSSTIQKSIWELQHYPIITLCKLVIGLIDVK